MNHCKMLTVILLEAILICIWNVSGFYAVYPIRHIKLSSGSGPQHPASNFVKILTLDDKPIRLVETMDEHFYIGAVNGLYRVSWANLSQGSQRLVVNLLPSDPGAQVRYLYSIPSKMSAFVCLGRGSEGPAIGCRVYNMTDAGRAQLPWGQATQVSSRWLNALVDGILMPASPLDPERVSLRLNGSHFFVSAFPNMFDTLDITELLWPDFGRVGRTTADSYMRKNRELWISKTARAIRLAARADQMYLLFTEEAFEASNYYGSVSGEDFRSAGALVKLPRFTRLARICLNDPGIQQPSGGDSMRVMTSFFKLRLICRNGSVDYDVLELATEVAGPAGTFYGLFSLQNSPRNGYQAVCRFTLDEAEALIARSDFIQLKRDSLQSPYYANRLSRGDFARLSERKRPTECAWTSQEVDRVRYSDLLVERTAPLMARPLIAASLLTFAPGSEHAGAVTAMSRVDGGVARILGDLLLLGTDRGALLKVFAPADLSAARVLEVLELPPPLSGSRVDRVLSRTGHVFAVSNSAGAVVALPLSRCQVPGLVPGCSECAALGDPLCSWLGGACVFGAGPAGPTGGGSLDLASDCGSETDGPSAGPTAATTAGLGTVAATTRQSPALHLSRHGLGDLSRGGADAGSAAAAAATGQSSDGASVPVATFASVLVSLCALGFAVGFLAGYLVRLRRRSGHQRRARRAAGSPPSGNGRRKSPSGSLGGPETGGTREDAAAAVPLRRGAPGKQQPQPGRLQAVSNEYTEHPLAQLLQVPQASATARVASSHSSAASWQSCYADAVDGEDAIDHRDEDWQFI